jgi:uncharacterized membrane protein YciS (DUF1049 family)
MAFITRILKLIFFLGIVFFCILIATQNTSSMDVSISPFFKLHTIPAYLVILGAFACGLICSAVWHGWEGIRQRLRIFILERKVKALETKVTSSENMPPASATRK